jgi:hypothetical protein
LGVLYVVNFRSGNGQNVGRCRSYIWQPATLTTNIAAKSVFLTTVCIMDDKRADKWYAASFGKDSLAASSKKRRRLANCRECRPER